MKILHAHDKKTCDLHVKTFYPSPEFLSFESKKIDSQLEILPSPAGGEGKKKSLIGSGIKNSWKYEKDLIIIFNSDWGCDAIQQVGNSVLPEWGILIKKVMI